MQSHLWCNKKTAPFSKRSCFSSCRPPRSAIFSNKPPKKKRTTHHHRPISRRSYVTRDHLDFFHFIGRVIGKAIHDAQNLEVRNVLPREFSRRFFVDRGLCFCFVFSEWEVFLRKKKKKTFKGIGRKLKCKLDMDIFIYIY